MGYDFKSNFRKVSIYLNLELIILLKISFIQKWENQSNKLTHIL